MRKNQLITFTAVILLSLALTGLATPDHCEILRETDTFFMLQNQLHTIPLSHYVAGYNLKYQSSHPEIASVFQPIKSIGSEQLDFNQGYSLVNSDVLQSQAKQWYREGMIFTQKDGQNIGIATGYLTGSKQAPTDLIYTYYKLPVKSTCFSGKMIDQDWNIAIDCQSLDGDTDLVCYVNTKSTAITCTTLDSLIQVSNRKTNIINVGSQKYLLSTTYSYQINEAPSKPPMTFITIYHINPDYIDFVNIIDSHQLGLKFTMTVNDVDITKDGLILISDSTSTNIVIAEYILPNNIRLNSVWDLAGQEITAIQVTTQNTLLVGKKSMITQYNLKTKQQIRSYQLDIGDNFVHDIQANSFVLVVKTDKNYLYVYDRETVELQYMLTKISVQDKHYLVSPYFNVMYFFDSKTSQIVEITDGYIMVSKVDVDTNIAIQATSSVSSCSFTLQINHVQNGLYNIFVKEELNHKNFKIGSAKDYSIDLDRAYGGPNLMFTVPQSTNKIKFDLKHMSKYPVTTTLKGLLLYQIVAYDDQNFLYVGASETKLWIQKCTTNTNNVLCSPFYDSKISNPPTLLSAKQRNNGDVIVVWVEDGQYGDFTVLTIRGGKVNPIRTIFGDSWRYSSITIAQDKIFFTMKTSNILRVYSNIDVPSLLTIDQKEFNQMYPMFGGFFPREVYISPLNDDIFYVKFPKSIAAMKIVQGKPIILSNRQVLTNLIKDTDWTVVIGRETFIVFTPTSVTEYSLLGGQVQIPLHTINLGDSKFVLPVVYSDQTNTVLIKTTDNNIIYYRLNKPSTDSFYYQVSMAQLSQQNQIPKVGSSFSLQSNWMILPQLGIAYYQNQITTLDIIATIDQKQFKEDFNFTMKISGSAHEINIDSKVVAVNYPTIIKANDAQNDQIALPSDSSKTKRVQIKLPNYFTGSISKYALSCPYCHTDKIKLETTFKNPIQNKNLIGAQSIIQAYDGHVLVLSDNRVELVDASNQIVSYKVLSTTLKCQQIGFSDTFSTGYGVIVFCSGPNSQQIMHLNIDKNNQFTANATYTISQDAIIYNVDQIHIVKISQDSHYIFIQDNDITFDSISKASNVKIFTLTKDNLVYLKSINSLTFNIPQGPINDMDITPQGIVAVTIGNTGVGFATLSQDIQQVLQNIQFIDFTANKELQQYVLEDTIYQQVQIVEYNVQIKKLKIFVTSTTSLNIVINLNIQDSKKISIVNVAQLYNRYGQLISYNWQHFNKNYVLLAFYNEKTHEQTIAYYPRSEQGLISFNSALTLTIPKNLLQEHSLLATSNNKLFVADVGSPASEPKVTRYEVQNVFNLILSYNSPGSFDKITIEASNAFNKVETKVSVHFDGQDDGGLKWYTVVIIVVLVLIVLGVGYGMFLKIKKSKKDKKVSLLSQTEDVDQVV